jgi:hypothetical protein
MLILLSSFLPNDPGRAASDWRLRQFIEDIAICSLFEKASFETILTARKCALRMRRSLDWISDRSACSP